MYITALRQSHASYFINITNRIIPPHLFAGPAKLKTFYSTRSFIFPRKGNSVSTLSQTNFFLTGKTVRLRKTKTGTPTVTQCYVSRKKNQRVWAGWKRVLHLSLEQVALPTCADLFTDQFCLHTQTRGQFSVGGQIRTQTHTHRAFTHAHVWQGCCSYLVSVAISMPPFGFQF